MKDCNAKATGEALRADARRHFMKTCLSGGKVQVEFGAAESSSVEEAGAAPASPVVEPQEEGQATGEARPVRPKNPKLGPCIGEARTRDLKGAERKAFMSDCLKPDSP